MRATATTCWSLAIGIGLLAPSLPVRAQAPAQARPAQPQTPPQPVWQMELDPSDDVQAVAGSSAIYVFGGSPPLQAFALEDGHRLWSAGEGNGATLLIDGARIFLVSAGGVTALDAADGTFEWASLLPPGQPTSAAGGGLLVTVVEQSLFVFNAADGRGLTSATLDAPLQIQPLISDTLVIVATSDGRLTALERSSGHRAWSRQLDTPVDAMAVYAGRLYLSGSDGGLYCFLARNGQFEWRFSLYSRSSGRAAVDDRFAYVALFDNTVQAIDRISGTRKWYQTLTGRPVRPVWPVGDRLFVVQADGDVIVLERATGARVARLEGGEGARQLEAGGLVPGPTPAAFTVAKDTSGVRRLSLWRPQP